MAYAEKRVSQARGSKGKVSWRARYQKPDGTFGSESGFPTKRTALDWGNEQERQIKEGRWIDPEKRTATFRQFTQVFMESRRKRGRTSGTRWDRLENHILPRWGDVPLGSISWFDVDSWQQTLSIEDISRGHCVSLMSTIMTAAVDAGYITANPLFGRRRTRATASESVKPKTSKRRDGGARPEDALLVAQRLGPARGIHVLTTAFSGPRWGEGLGLHRDNVLLKRRESWGAGEFVCPVLRIVETYAEYQERAEDGSKKGYVLRLEPTKNDGSTRDVDVPPFLARLLRYHLADWPHDRIFCTSSGTPWRRGNWSRSLRPACDGRKERTRRQGVAPREAWEPILPGLDMQALRRLHDTMQSEIGVKEPLAFEAAGHRRPGIKRHYQKPTPAMRAERLAGLEDLFWRSMANVGLRTLWGRVDLVRRPAK